MAEITLKQLAADLQISVDRLLSHTKELGFAYHLDSLLSTTDKKRIEEFLKSPDKVSVTRRSQSALTVNSTQGKARTINVEVRKTRTYVRRGASSATDGATDDETAKKAPEASDRFSRATSASRGVLPSEPRVQKSSPRASAALPPKEIKKSDKRSTNPASEDKKPDPNLASMPVTPPLPVPEKAKALAPEKSVTVAKHPDAENQTEAPAEGTHDKTDEKSNQGSANKPSSRSGDNLRDSRSRLGENRQAPRSSGPRRSKSDYQNVTSSARLESGNQGEVRRRLSNAPAELETRPRSDSRGDTRPDARPERREGFDKPRRSEGNRQEVSREMPPPRTPGSDLRADNSRLLNREARPERPRSSSERPADQRSSEQRGSERLSERSADDNRQSSERSPRSSRDRPPRSHDLRSSRPPISGRSTERSSERSPERNPERTFERSLDRAPGHEERPPLPSGRNEDSSFALKDKERRPALRQKERPKSQQDEERNKAAKKANKTEKRWEDVDPLLAKTVPLSDLEALEEVQSEKGGRRKKSQSKAKHAFAMPTAPQVREVEIYEGISVADLAQQMAVKAPEVIKALFKMGVMATINHALDCDTATLVVEEMGHSVKLLNTQDVEEKLFSEFKDVEKEYIARPPVVTIMGHVDHGKTSLLDYIRRAKVAEGEAGGITQHVGAYHVTTPRGVITFLDTPGHAAFTAMRSRGATVTDIVVLVVAADDSVMPQTIEAIQHAKAAHVPVIVAVNKMDKPEANPERVKQDLVKHEVVAEDFGGEVMFTPVSAKTGVGIDGLLEAILLQAEVLELKAVANGPAQGHILEASLDKGRGPVATVLVQDGYLKKGDVVLSGTEYGRVRAMFDENGKAIDKAGPALPVVILGLSGAPSAGDSIQVVGDERQAREVAEFRQRRLREEKIAQAAPSGFDSVFEKMSSGEQALLHAVIKADVQGSAEALRDSFIKLGTAQVQVKVMAASVGGINESDIHLAVTSAAVVIGFNVRADAGARRLAEEKGINIRYYSIIYDAIDDIKQVLSGMLAPETKEQIIGIAKVLSVFRSSKFGTVAGCLVMEGMVKGGNPIRVLRDNIVVHEGDLSSLRRFKEEVTEVRSGTECGIGLKNFSDVREGDAIEVFERITVQRTL